jgi:hypothetical protein
MHTHTQTCDDIQSGTTKENIYIYGGASGTRAENPPLVMVHLAYPGRRPTKQRNSIAHKHTHKHTRTHTRTRGCTCTHTHTCDAIQSGKTKEKRMRIYGGASDLSERKAYVRTGKCICAFTELDMMVHTRPIYKTKLGTLSNNSESNMWYTRDQFTDGTHGKNHKEDFSQKSIASCVDQHRHKSSGGASLWTAPGQNPGEEL